VARRQVGRHMQQTREREAARIKLNSNFHGDAQSPWLIGRPPAPLASCGPRHTYGSERLYKSAAHGAKPLGRICASASCHCKAALKYVIARRAAPWQSRLSCNRRWIASCLAMTSRGSVTTPPRHCEARSAVAIQAFMQPPMDRFVPRDDGPGVKDGSAQSLRCRPLRRHCDAVHYAAVAMPSTTASLRGTKQSIGPNASTWIATAFGLAMTKRASLRGAAYSREELATWRDVAGRGGTWQSRLFPDASQVNRPQEVRAGAAHRRA
jgi:hypothetical protein